MRERLRVDVRPCAHEHGRRKVEAMLAGIRRHGPVQETSTEPDISIGWAWRGPCPQARHTLVLECGYVGDRLEWTSARFDGLNGRGWCPDADDGGQRWRRYHGDVMRPWREESGHCVLLIGQCASDTAVRGLGLRPWYRDAATRGAEAYRLPVLFRPHPKAAGESVPGVPRLRGELENALAQAAVAITMNSNAGVLAALAGVPVVACDEGSMARPVAGHEVGEYVRPDREKWVADLAWSQWTEDELRRGEAWEHLRSGLA